MRITAIALTMTLMATSAYSADWAQWRGPFHNGSADAKNLPVKFSPTEGVVWKAPLPGPSAATPVIAGGRVYLPSGVADSKELFAICLDAKTGKERWRRPISDGNQMFGRVNDLASPSAVTDGDGAIFMFGTGDLLSFDVEGKERWSFNLADRYGPLSIKWGFSSSPLLHKGVLTIPLLRNPEDKHSGVASSGTTGLPSLIIALDPKTGKELWSHTRPTDALDESFESYTSLIPFTHNGREELLLAGGDYITGHDPKDGTEFWRFFYNVEKTAKCRTIVSPVAGDGLVYVIRPRYRTLHAINAGAKGHVPTEDAAWTYTEQTSDDATELLYKGRLFVLSGGKKKKQLACLDAKTGESKGLADFESRSVIRSSPTGADGKIYFMNEDARVWVVSADAEMKTLAINEMGGKPTRSSVAIANDQLFIRTGDALYCVGR